MKKLELLAPARDLEAAKAAVDFGADAVYMGAPAFGARSGVGNSLDDIRAACDYAHKFYARAYVAVNTILFDDELDAAFEMIVALAEAGADALIVQDMAIFEMATNRADFPKIPLFASTQCDNRSVERVKWLGEIGAGRVILARELSAAQIAAMPREVELESFVHGALCVSYSGQCYLAACCNAERSGNRGTCSQNCRQRYSLVAEDGERILNGHLLSLRDFNASDWVQKLAEAGVSSFKIEGRLKDVSYVKNTVGFYRGLLDGFSERTSSGRVEFDMEFDLKKSFNRGFTDYFLSGKRSDMSEFRTPKNIGERVGKVSRSGRAFFEYSGKPLHAQDGLCYFDAEGELQGFLVNKVEENRVFVRDIPELAVGTELYRNSDFEFEKALAASRTGRRIGVSFTINAREITAIDEDGNTVSLPLPEAEPARDASKMQETIKSQLSKTGESDFYIMELKLNFPSNTPFMAISALNNVRRTALEKLMEERLARRPLLAWRPVKYAPYFASELDYRANVANKMAKAFYEKCGVSLVQDAFEISRPRGVEIMRTKYCLRFAAGLCLKETSDNRKLFLEDLKGQKRPLEFDCKNCEMVVKDE